MSAVKKIKLEPEDSEFPEPQSSTPVSSNTAYPSSSQNRVRGILKKSDKPATVVMPDLVVPPVFSIFEFRSDVKRPPPPSPPGKRMEALRAEKAAREAAREAARAAYYGVTAPPVRPETPKSVPPPSPPPAQAESQPAAPQQTVPPPAQAEPTQTAPGVPQKEVFIPKEIKEEPVDSEMGTATDTTTDSTVKSAEKPKESLEKVVKEEPVDEHFQAETQPTPPVGIESFVSKDLFEKIIRNLAMDKENGSNSNENSAMDTQTPPKKVKGRPRKSDNIAVETYDSMDNSAMDTQTPPKRGRGRPRKSDTPVVKTMAKKRSSARFVSSSKANEKLEKEEEKLWSSQDQSEMCTSCNVKIGKSKAARMDHWFKDHYNLVYKCISNMADVERWLSIRVGPADHDVRVCLDCPKKKKLYFSGRLDLLKHIKKSHAKEYRELRQTYRVYSFSKRREDRAVHDFLY